MKSSTGPMLTCHELAKRWGRSEAAISLATAVGVGPRCVKNAGLVLFPLEEIRRYEQESTLLSATKVLH